MRLTEWVCTLEYSKCTPEKPHLIYTGCGEEFAGWKCDHPGCDEILHHLGEPGAGTWMVKKNGESWCPRHLPAWVAGWRTKRRQGNEER